jgi:hypothetical protein
MQYPAIPSEWVWALFLLGVALAIRIRATARLSQVVYPRHAAPPRPLADLRAVPGVDRAFVEAQAARLRALGFRPLLDYELPHLDSAQIRTVYAAFVSGDGAIVATVVQRFTRQFAHEWVALTTVFASGHRLITANAPMAVPELNRFILRLHLPESTDPGVMLQRHVHACDEHERRLGSPLTIADPQDLARQLTAAWDREIGHFLSRRFVVPAGEKVRVTGRMARAIFWAALQPFRPGHGLLPHLLTAAAPAALAFALLRSGLGAGVPPSALAILAGLLVGTVTGVCLGTHGLLWSVALPALVTIAATDQPALAGDAVTAALLCFHVAHVFSVGRAQTRGRRALAGRRS